MTLIEIILPRYWLSLQMIDGHGFPPSKFSGSSRLCPLALDEIKIVDGPEDIGFV